MIQLNRDTYYDVWCKQFEFFACKLSNDKKFLKKYTLLRSFKIEMHKYGKNCLFLKKEANNLEFVTGGVELLKAILHGYAGGLIFMK